jgi:hypothetical protein
MCAALALLLLLLSVLSVIAAADCGDIKDASLLGTTAALVGACREQAS